MALRSSVLTVEGSAGAGSEGNIPAVRMAAIISLPVLTTVASLRFLDFINLEFTVKVSRSQHTFGKDGCL